MVFFPADRTARPFTGLVLAAVAAALVAACGDESTTAPEDAPEGHTVSRDGVFHAPGLRDPVNQCASCHGTDLRGGDNGEPSCFSCHGQVWS